MKIYFPLLILTVIAIAAKAQVEKKDQASSTLPSTVNRDFKNQGEQEDYWAVELFKKDYKKQLYKRYDGHIIIDDNIYKYNDTVLTVNTGKEMRAIFDKGVFYPAILPQAFQLRSQAKVKLLADTDKLALLKTDIPASEKGVFQFIKIDSLKISSFEEMKFLETTPKQKRFRFWLFTPGFGNPTVYFIELTNSKATTNTKLAEFINGASLTFCKKGWIII